MISCVKKLWYWFVTVSRGYSAPMSVLNWLLIFYMISQTYKSPNLLYGVIALVGILAAHLGTNLFDDVIDHISNSPKQECKTKYLEEGFTTIKVVFIVACLFFGIALIIGAFFYSKFGLLILQIAGIAGLIILLYPKLNHIALGEIAIGLCFGALMFAGVCLVMSGGINPYIMQISIPVSIMTASVAFVHSIMDFDFDKLNKKYTLCVLTGSKGNATKLLMIIYAAALYLTIYYAKEQFLPQLSILSILLIPFMIKLYINLTHLDKDFMTNFRLARNISIFYNIILMFAFLFKV